MKSTFFLCFSFFVQVIIQGQSNSLQVLATAGDHFAGNNTQISWTIGESVIETYANNSIQLTQGFHQTHLIITPTENISNEFTIKVFPNPTRDLLNIKWDTHLTELELLLIDHTGRKLYHQNLDNQSQYKWMELTPYDAGCYFLHVRIPNNAPSQTFKIIKIK